MLKITRPAAILALLVIVSLLLTANPQLPPVAARVDTATGSGSVTSKAEHRSGSPTGLITTLGRVLTDAWSSVATSDQPSSRIEFLIPAQILVLNPPTNVSVTSASATQISLSWNAPAGSVDHYEIERSVSPSGSFDPVGTSISTSFNDTTPVAGNAYLYRVRAVDAQSAPSLPSHMVFGTAVTLTPVVAGTTLLTATSITQLRTAVNAVRTLAGVGNATWTDESLSGVSIKTEHIQQLRNNLNTALIELDVSPPSYTDATLTANVTPIRQVHISQLQLAASRGVSSSSGETLGDGSVAQERLDPRSRVGGGIDDPLSRNFNLNLPLVSLRGRAGLNLSLALSYNSLVWTRNGTSISFDDDNGFPSPGFRLGFPVIEPLYFNPQVGKYAYLLIASDGSRTELRQVGTSEFFESADSGHILLDTSLTLPAPDTGKFVLRTTNGTKMWYEWKVDAYQCTQIKDRNGNYLTVNYTAAGKIDTIVDTVNRTIKFNYVNGWLDTITQVWKQGTANERTHTWASFAYTDVTIQTSFTGLTVVGAPNGSIHKMLSKVTLDDDSATPSNNTRYEFAYTSWGQVWKVTNFAADNRQLNYRSYNLRGSPLLPTGSEVDCPRFTERRDWAENWNRNGAAGASGLPVGPEQEVVTTYLAPNVNENDSWTMPDGTNQTGTRTQITAPDGTADEIYFIGQKGTNSGWRRGLPALIRTYSGTTLQRQVMQKWKQENEAVSYLVDPRVEEVNTYDPANNRRRVTIAYQTVDLGNNMSCKLPQDILEYQANASTVLRRNHTDYNPDAAYKNRRILGLPSARSLYEVDPTTLVETLVSKIGFFYDETAIEGTSDPAAIQHDNANFGVGFLTGRANLTTTRRYDVTNLNLSTATTSKYNRTGSVVSSKDGANHQTTFSYSDAFASNGTTLDAARPFTTLAYQTSTNDADGYTSKARYDYDFGAITWKQIPQPNGTANTPGPEQTFTYDVIGRLTRTTNLSNSAFTRYNYGPNYLESFTSINTTTESANEGHVLIVNDGLGRVIAKVSDHPGSAGGSSAELILYDNVGRIRKQSNPTETSVSVTGSLLNPYQFAPAGDDLVANGGFGWQYVEQTYDWKGRPLVTTNQDGTTRTIEYSGCGCAGGEVVTATDEGIIDGAETKRRQQKSYADVLGRIVKTELLNWQGGSVYSSTRYRYNALDQVIQLRQFSGAGPGDPNDFSCPTGTCQQTLMTYDGHGRMKTRQTPAQSAATTYSYFDDDLINVVTDARGVTSTFSYNARHLNTGVTYGTPGGVAATAAVGYTYDSVGNRKQMTDGLGSVTYNYNAQSQLTSETRVLPIGSYTFDYEYNLMGELKNVTDPFVGEHEYSYDSIGRLAGFSKYMPQLLFAFQASDIKYRAWGDFRSLTFTLGPRFEAKHDKRTAISGVKLIRDEFSNHFQFNLTNNPNGTVKQYRYNEVGAQDNYSYDSAGRVSGVTSPTWGYNQTYTYNEWNNLTNRSGRYFDSDPPPFTATYVNNRKDGWIYDTEGNVLTTETKQFTYDAESRAVTDNTTSQAYDGDGLAVRIIDGPKTTYHIRSTVMNGQVVAEVNGTGERLVSYYYANGQLIAQSQLDTSIPGVNWERFYWSFADPIKNDRFVINDCNMIVAMTRLDPLGNVAVAHSGTPACGEEEPPPDNVFLEGIWDALGNYQDYATGCVVDGIERPCSEATALVNMGVGVELPPGVTPVTFSTNGDQVVITILRATADGGLIGHLGDIPVTGLNQGPPPVMRRRDGTRRAPAGDPEGVNNTPGTIGIIGGSLLANGGFVNPQTPYDPRADFRDYAVSLIQNTNITDCNKLVLMIYKAGQVFAGKNRFEYNGRDIVRGLMSGLTEYTAVTLGGRSGPSDRRFRVGVLGRDPNYHGGFRDSGFDSRFQEPGGNQVRHFIFYFGAGYGIGETLANEGLYDAEGTRSGNNADVALGWEGTKRGAKFDGDYVGLAKDVWRHVCNETSTLNLP